MRKLCESGNPAAAESGGTVCSGGLEGGVGSGGSSLDHDVYAARMKESEREKRDGGDGEEVERAH